jgi:hypothetical protein
MKSNTAKSILIARIQEEIINTNNELGKVEELVRQDIDRLLSERVKNITNEERKAFETKYLDELKNEKEKSLKNALKKFEELKSTLVNKYDRCEECMNA